MPYKSFLPGRTTGFWQHLIKEKQSKSMILFMLLWTNSETSAATVKTLFNCNLCNISMVPVQKQLGGSDCGLFAKADCDRGSFSVRRVSTA